MVKSGLIINSGVKMPPPVGPVCYLRGTNIRTTKTERRVEELNIGDPSRHIVGREQTDQMDRPSEIREEI